MLWLMQTANVWAIDKDMNPGMLPLGHFDFIPLLSISESHSDNIFYNDLNRKSSLITRIHGGGELALRRKLDRYALHYSFLSSQYHSSPADNYVDHNLGATAHFEITQRNRLDFSSSLIYSHLQRGTSIFQGDNINMQPQSQIIVTQPGVGVALLNEPIQYHQYNANTSYRYGRTDAPGNLGLELGWNQTTYDNNLFLTNQWDRTQLQITPGFYWRLRPKTYLTTQMQNTFVDYYQNSGQSYNLQRYLMGVTWAQSLKTKGSIRAGYYQQEYSGAAQQSTDGFTWDGQVQWLPLAYSILSFNFSKNIQPSVGSSAIAQLQIYDAGWQHSWPNRVTTQLSGSYREAHYQNAAQGIGSGINFKFDVEYHMRSWMNIGVNYLRSDYQNTLGDKNSTQNVFMLYITATPQALAY